MQGKFYLPNHKPTKVLSKNISKVSIANTSCSSASSTSSISHCTQLIDDQYRKLAAKWIFTYSKKLSKDTQFLAIFYINQLRSKSIFLNAENYQKVALTTLLIAYKMNEIFTPKINSMLAKCKKTITKEEVLQMESRIILAFDFDMACKGTIYSQIKNLLGDKYSQKIEDSEKLLRVICTNRQLYQFGQKMLALSIILLIFPEFNVNIKSQESLKIKIVAKQILSIYSEAKERHDLEKKRQFK